MYNFIFMFFIFLISCDTNHVEKEKSKVILNSVYKSVEFPITIEKNNKKMTHLSGKLKFVPKQDLMNNGVTFSLYCNEILVDILKIDGVVSDVREDLIKIQDLWYYSYELRCGSGCESSYQMIIGQTHDKIQILYESPKVNNQRYEGDDYGGPKLDPLDFRNEKTEFNITMNSKNEIQVKEIFQGVRDSKSSVTKTFNYNLKFDSTSYAYYNVMLPMKGTYRISTNSNSDSSIQINSEVPCLNFNFIKRIKYKNHWYTLFLPERRLVE